MRRLATKAIGALCLALTGCAAGPTENERHAAVSSVIDCLARESGALDDHASDAVVIGYAAVGACGSVIKASNDIGTRNLNYAGTKRFEATLNEKYIQWATEIVLTLRARRAKSG